MGTGVLRLILFSVLSVWFSRPSLVLTCAIFWNLQKSCCWRLSWYCRFHTSGNRVPLKVVLTELIVKVDTSGNSSFAELLWRSIITELVDTGDTKEVTLLEATVLIKVLTSPWMPFTASVMFHLRKVSVVEQVSVSLSLLHTDVSFDGGVNITTPECHN